jgi:LPS sulfotransferase NodH
MKVLFDKQFVFIIGAPRSGTTWLQAMLGAHPSVCTFGELQLYDFYTAPWVAAWKKQVELGGFNGLPTLWDEETLYQFLREFLDRVYSLALDAKPGATILLDKHPGYSRHVEHIDLLVPNAKFIHVIRDGRDVAVSLLAASEEWAKLWAPKDIRSAAVFWKALVLEARKAQPYTQRYMELRYEDLFSNGIGVLKDLFEFIGAPIDDEDVKSIFNSNQFEKMKQKGTGTNKRPLPEAFFRKGQVGDWQTVLNPAQRLIFHDMAGDLLCELGYANDSWWIGRWHQRLTLPLLNKRRRKAILSHAIKRLLGPTWTGRLRAIKNY